MSSVAERALFDTTRPTEVLSTQKNPALFSGDCAAHALDVSLQVTVVPLPALSRVILAAPEAFLAELRAFVIVVS